MLNNIALPRPMRLALAAALTAGALAGSALAADDALARVAGCDPQEHMHMPKAGGDPQPGVVAMRKAGGDPQASIIAIL